MDITDKRYGTDRRVYSLSTFMRCAFAPRRMHGRRSEDRRNAVLDRIDSGVCALAVLLMLLSVSDSIFTLTLIGRGGSEINPFMNVLLQHSVWAFTGVKMLLTAVPVVFLAATANLRLFNRWRARSALAALVGFYLGLIAYELALLSMG